MNRIAKFEKVSFEQFKKDWQNTFTKNSFTDDEINNIYRSITLPKRATAGSAGYDFFIPVDFVIGANTVTNIPTGIKCAMDEGWVLHMYPRSGHGFKYGLHLANTVGVIDKDYYNNAGNEGHIFVKLINDSIISEDVVLKKDTAFCQGVFAPFGITLDDNTCAERIGGLGSTT